MVTTVDLQPRKLNHKNILGNIQSHWCIRSRYSKLFPPHSPQQRKPATRFITPSNFRNLNDSLEHKTK